MNSLIRFGTRAAGGLLLLLLTALPVYAQWSESLLDTLTRTGNRKETQLQSLALDRLGQAHLVWQEAQPAFNGWRLYYSNRMFQAMWAHGQPVGDSTHALFNPALTVSPRNNRPYIAFVDSADIFIAQLIGSTWEVARVTNTTNFDGSPTLAADSAGLIHIAWITNTGSDSVAAYHLAYAVGDSNAWTTQVLDSSRLGEFGTGAAPQISVTPGGTPHILYRGGDYLSYRMHHAWAQDTGPTLAWNFEILTSPNAEDLTGSIAVVSENDIHVAVAGADGFGFPSFTYYLHQTAGGPWSEPELVSAGATNPQLQVDSLGTPHVVWVEVSGNFYTGNLFYSARHPLGNWQSQLVAGPIYYNPSFKIDHRGYGHVAFNSIDSTGLVYDIYYKQSTEPLFVTAVPGGVEVTPDSVDFGEVALGDSVQATITVANIGADSVTVTYLTAAAPFTTDFTGAFVIGPGESAPVTVFFHADSAGSYSGALQLVTNAAPETLSVWLAATATALSSEDRPVSSVPSEFYLAQNYPNPFNPSTSIEFGLPSSAHIIVRVHDLLGREVAVLVDGTMSAGTHRITWECRECASGTYLIALSGPDFTLFRKATLVR